MSTQKIPRVSVQVEVSYPLGEKNEYKPGLSPQEAAELEAKSVVAMLGGHKLETRVFDVSVLGLSGSGGWPGEDASP